MGSPVQPGDVLAQKYRVDRVLGIGGMGVVVQATNLDLDQRVALKFMLTAVAESGDANARFEREAKVAARLKSDHVAQVKDRGRFENGAPYIVMEFLEGTDLSAEIKQMGPMPVAMAAEFVIQACDAIGEAHSLGVIHRDLKPANLFLARRADGAPHVKVLDFGISKNNAFNDSDIALTKTSTMLGSPLYMSPEQMRSAKDVDGRTDVWSLGVILYEMLAGRPPFLSETLGALMHAVMSLPHAPLQSVRPELPPDLCALVDDCLAKTVEARARNVAEVVRRLAPFCPPRSLHIVERVTTLSGAPTRPTPMPPSFGVAPSWQGAVPPTPQPGSFGGQPQTPSQPPLASPPAAVALPVAYPAQTSPGWGGTAPGGPNRGNALRLVGILAGVAVVVASAAGGSYALLRTRGSSPTAAASAAPPVVVASAVAQEPAVPAAVAPVASALPPSTGAAAIASAPSATQRPKLAAAAAGLPPPKPAGAASSQALPPPAPPPPRPLSSPAPAPSPAAPPKPHSKPNCTPPYSYDAAGNKVFKVECM